jgi:hypothetical protein
MADISEAIEDAEAPVPLDFSIDDDRVDVAAVADYTKLIAPSYTGTGMVAGTAKVMTVKSRGLRRSSSYFNRVKMRVYKYAPFLSMGRKTLYDPDLPSWDSGHSSSSGSRSLLHVDKMKEAKLKEEVAANLISSKIRDGLHAPIIDVDFPVHVIPSQTPGHFHLAFDKVMPEEEYFSFLEALESFGIIEEGYKDMSILRGASFVRVTDDEEDGLGW